MIEAVWQDIFVCCFIYYNEVEFKSRQVFTAK